MLGEVPPGPKEIPASPGRTWPKAEGIGGEVYYQIPRVVHILPNGKRGRKTHLSSTTSFGCYMAICQSYVSLLVSERVSWTQPVRKPEFGMKYA